MSFSGEFYGVVSKTIMSCEMKWNLDETSTLNGEFYFIVSYAFNSKTHRELVIVPREFYIDETHFFSLFLNTQPCHKKNPGLTDHSSAGFIAAQQQLLQPWMCAFDRHRPQESRSHLDCMSWSAGDHLKGPAKARSFVAVSTHQQASVSSTWHQGAEEDGRVRLKTSVAWLGPRRPNNAGASLNSPIFSSETLVTPHSWSILLQIQKIQEHYWRNKWACRKEEGDRVRWCGVVLSLPLTKCLNHLG